MKVLKKGENQSQWNLSEKDRLNRTKLYDDWRMKLVKKYKGTGKFPYAQDIDLFEYTIVKDEIIPVAVIELSKAEDNIRSPDAYLTMVDEKREQQMKVSTFVAKKMGIPAFYVQFEPDFKRLFVKFMHLRNPRWIETTPNKWEKFLIKLHMKAKGKNNESNTVSEQTSGEHFSTKSN